MIDQSKKQKLAEQKARVHRRVYAEVDPNNYEFIPAKKQIDYYDNDVPQRVAVYARVSTDNIQQTSSYELQKKYYEEFVVHHPNWTLVKIYADEGIRYSESRKDFTDEPAQKPGPKPPELPVIKTMPTFDPDAEVTGLTLTIPSWTSSIDRTKAAADLRTVSPSAKRRLEDALLSLQSKAQDMIRAIKEDS